ncbi:MAG TPA: T9SS type B sorting domain-containing protein [Saprospiraceae bacterium]|nr:T9SS type B sorting domain-containing protein [Saprospiraceae bacterium]
MNNFTSFTQKLWSLGFSLALVLTGVKLSAQIQISLDLQKPTCNGYTNGGATATATGGQEPYVYQWSVATAGGHTAWSLTGGDYSVTVTDANGLTATESFTLQQPDPIVTNVQLVGDPCTSDTYAAYTVGGTPGYSYAWNTGESTQIIQNPNTSSLSVTVTDVFGCQSNAAGSVNNPLGVNLELSDITCNGYNDGVGVVSATGGHQPYTFLWSTGSSDVYVSGLSAGDYSVTVIDGTGCTASASGTIVDPPATDVTIIKDPTCGVPATATAIATGGVEPYMFMWINNGQLVSTDSFYTFTEPGTMYLCVMNANHCPHDNWVTVSPGFELNANVVDADCNGNGGSIDLMPTTVVGPVTYNWTGPAGFVDPHTEDLSGLAPGTYSVTATDAGGCTATYTANINQNSMVADFDFALLGCTNNELSIQFSGYPNSPDVTAYNWSFSGNQQQETAQFVTNPNEVTLTIEYGNGCTSSVTKPVDFDVIDVAVPGAQSACMGDSLQIAIQNNNGSAIDYSWTPASLIQSGANTPNPVLNTNLAGNHTLQVEMTNASGCVVTQTVDLGVSDPAALVIDQSLLSYRQCEGFKVDFENTNPNAANYSWQFPDGTMSSDSNASFDFDSLGMGNYEVLLIPDDTTCANPIPYNVEVGQEAKVDFDFSFVGCVDSITFKDLSTAPHPISEWTWEFPTEYKTQNPTIPAGLVNNSDFMARLTIEFPDGCLLSLEKQIPMDSINVHIPDSLLICGQEGVSLNPSGNTDYQYTWSPAIGLDDPTSVNPLANPSTTTTYTVDIVNVNAPDSCMVTKMVKVVVAPVTVQATGDTTVCDNQTQVPISAVHTGDSINWYDDPALTTSISNSSSLMVLPGTYYALSTNAAGCQMIDTVVVAQNPVTMAVAQNNFTLCMGEDAALEINGLHSDDHTQWYLDNTLIGTGSPLVVNPTHSGTYVAVVTNADGCSATDTAQVDVVEVVAEVTASEMSIYRSQSTKLSATEGFISYLWSPDDGSLDDIFSANPKASPEETTTYTVTVTDDNGCTAERSITIEVKNTECGEPYIYLPNAFSPNGDGDNEVLYLRGLNLSEIHLSIYNRWGQQVFETRDQSYGWDGTFNGDPVAPDVYGFYLRVKCDNGEKYFKKGNITVLK